MAIRVRERVEFSAYERSYLPEVTRGLVVTLTHFFGNILGAIPGDPLRRRDRRWLQTVRYPEEKRTPPPRYRARIVLTRDPDGGERCVACHLCSG